MPWRDTNKKCFFKQKSKWNVILRNIIISLWGNMVHSNCKYPRREKSLCEGFLVEITKCISSFFFFLSCSFTFNNNTIISINFKRQGQESWKISTFLQWGMINYEFLVMAHRFQFKKTKDFSWRVFLLNILPDLHRTHQLNSFRDTSSLLNWLILIFS